MQKLTVLKGGFINDSKFKKDRPDPSGTNTQEMGLGVYVSFNFC